MQCDNNDNINGTSRTREYYDELTKDMKIRRIACKCRDCSIRLLPSLHLFVLEKTEKERERMFICVLESCLE